MDLSFSLQCIALAQFHFLNIRVPFDVQIPVKYPTIELSEHTIPGTVCGNYSVLFRLVNEREAMSGEAKKGDLYFPLLK